MALIDEKDVVILRQLQANARAPFGEIGAKVGLTEGAVRARVKRLLRKGVIQRFTIAVNPANTGFQILARIGVDASPAEIRKIAKELAKFNEVYFVALATGTHDVLVDILANDMESLKAFLVDKLARTPGVRGTDTSIVLETYKWKGSYDYRI